MFNAYISYDAFGWMFPNVLIQYLPLNLIKAPLIE